MAHLVRFGWCLSELRSGRSSCAFTPTCAFIEHVLTSRGTQSHTLWCNVCISYISGWYLLPGLNCVYFYFLTMATVVCDCDSCCFVSSILLWPHQCSLPGWACLSWSEPFTPFKPIFLFKLELARKEASPAMFLMVHRDGFGMRSLLLKKKVTVTQWTLSRVLLLLGHVTLVENQSPKYHNQ